MKQRKYIVQLIFWVKKLAFWENVQANQILTNTSSRVTSVTDTKLLCHKIGHLRRKKSGNFVIFGHGKPGKVREFH